MNQPNQLVIVDDDPDYSYLVAEALHICNPTCTLTAVQSGAELLAWLEKNQRPGLIFLDLNLPGSNGFEVLRRLKTSDQYKQIPVVILSTSERLADVHASYEIGANAYITKPILFTDLLPRLNLFSRYWLEQSEMTTQFWSKRDTLVDLN